MSSGASRPASALVLLLCVAAVTSGGLGCKSKSAGPYRSLMIAPHERGMPRPVEDPPRVRRIVDALGLEALPLVPCPPVFEEQRGTVMLFGDDGLGRNIVYVLDDGKRIELLSTFMGQCRRGPPADANALLAELARD